ncbi:hypothetical protein NUW58_g6400 [Xylaria curta]|uniref:Uncharacterized protein n=1 Tax=Xylaria curta TaxID=42375 RepID=A0ACC1NVP8_9PEZI|nr:hypothetical protein NUW58_g6400 [Xylaria curta]
MNASWPAWECRDQTDQVELYYNQPLRAKNRSLEDENLALKRLLREHGISWQKNQPKPHPHQKRLASHVLAHLTTNPFPHLPVEIQLRVLSYALTSPHPIVDPLCKSRPERMLPREKGKRNHIAIHFLATCRAYRFEGTRYLWSNNTFLFTSPASLRQFAELDLSYRQNIRHVTFRLIARFYDDEDRVHRLPTTYHPSLRLCSPPYDPACKSSPTQPRPRLLPGLESLRIDFVNFINDLLQYPPQQLHDLASHQLGCMLNEVILTGVPTDECGLRVSTELSGLLRDEGLLIDHAPTLVAVKDGIRMLQCIVPVCDHPSKVVRGMRINENHFFNDEHHRHSWADFPPAPPDEGEPPYSPSHSCRTIWKKVPIKLDGNERRWELFDRVSGMPWEDAEEEATMFDFLDDEEDPLVCENCGECHPGALLPEELMDLYDDDM